MIYIAAPYSHPDKDVVHSRMEMIYHVMGQLTKDGHHVVTPLFMHEIVKRNSGMPEDYVFWENYCLNMLKRCDKMIVLRLAGWDTSRGVAEEIKFCGKMNIPVEYI